MSIFTSRSKTKNLIKRQTSGKNHSHRDRSLRLESLEPRLLLSAEAHGPYALIEGQNLTLDASGSGVILTRIDNISWDLDDNGIFETNAGTGSSLTISWDDLQAFDLPSNGMPLEVNLRVEHDPVIGPNFYTYDDATLIINNAAPTPDAGGDYVIDEGQPLYLDATGTTDGDINDVLSYKWDLDNDGSFEFDSGVNPTPVVPWSTIATLNPAGLGNGSPVTIGLQVSDHDGGVADSTTQLTVNNVDPTAYAGGFYTIGEGDNVTLKGKGFDVNVNDTIDVYKWDLDHDGNFNDADTKNVNLTWTQLNGLGLNGDGDFIEIRLRVKDSDGGADRDTATIMVIGNSAPVDLDPNLGGAPGVGYTIYEGDPLPLMASASDAGDDTLEFLWNLNPLTDNLYDNAAGDITIVPWAAIEQLALPSNGTPMPISLRVDDGQGGLAYADSTLTILNRDPIADANGPYARNEGRGVWLDASAATDPDANDILTYTWKVDIGPDTFKIYQGPDSIVKIPWRQFESLGVAGDGSDMKLRLVVRDEDGGVDRDRSTTLTYNNVDPIADAGGPYMITEGEGLRLHGGGSSDVNDNDYPLTYRWSIGDEGGMNFVKTGKNPLITWTELDSLGFATDGTPLTIKLKVIDNDGGENLDKSLLLVIQNAAPDADAGGPYTINEGEELTLNAWATTDPGDNIRTFEYLWDLDGDGVYDDAAGPKPTISWDRIEALGLPSDGTSVPVSVRVDDGEEHGVDYARSSLAINNLAPLTDAGGPYLINEGRGLWVDASDTTDPDANDNLVYAWDIYADGTIDYFAGADPIARIPWQILENAGIPGTNADPIRLRLIVGDQEGNGQALRSHEDTMLVVRNVDPVADAGGPYMIIEGEGVRLNGTNSYDVNDNDYPLTYQWFVGDYDGVNILARGRTPFVPWPRLESLGLASDGTPLTIGLRVVDQDGAADLDKSLLLTISNAAPQIDEVMVGYRGSINEGQNLPLTALASDPGNDNLNYLWDLDADGVYDDAAGAQTVVNWHSLEALLRDNTHMTSDGSRMPISVRVDDGEGGVTFARASLMINNLAPVPDAGGPYVINEGNPLWVDARGTTDPDANDNLVFAWDIYADGVIDYFAGSDAVAAIPWQVLEDAGVYGDSDPVRLRLIVGDQEGNGQALRAHEDTPLIVHNVDPVADAGGPYQILEGEGVRLNGLHSYDVNSNDMFRGGNFDGRYLTFSWFVGDYNGVDFLARGHRPFIPWSTLENLQLASDGTPLTVGLAVSDPDGGRDFDKALLLVISNAAPEADAGGAYVINEGQPLHLDASATTDDGNDPLTFTWDLDHDGVFDDAAGMTPTISWDVLESLDLSSDGTPMTISVRADDGETGGVGIASTTLTINNLDPIPHANGPYEIFEGEDLFLDGSATYDRDANDQLSFKWDIWDDGSYDVLGGTDSTTLVPWSALESLIVDGNINENIPVLLRVTDGDGGVASELSNLVIKNVAPTADAGGPYVVMEGLPNGDLQLDGTGSSDLNANDVLTYDWDLNDDGIFDIINNPTPTVPWDTLEQMGLASYGTSLVISLKVTDDDGGTDIDRSLLLVINNAAPIAVANGPYEITEGENIILNATGSSDPGNDPLTFLWDLDDDGVYDDAAGAQPLVPWAALKALELDTNGNPQQIHLRVDDGEPGGTGFASAWLTIHNANPTANAGADQEINEGDTTIFFGEYSDPYAEKDAPFNFAWDFADGSPIVNAQNAVHTYVDNGVFNVTFTVTDKDGGSHTDTLILTVNNVAPDVDAGEDKIAVEGDVVAFSGQFTDPGINDTHTILWNFGDGATADTLDVQHTFADNGIYLVTLTVTDNDGGVGIDTITVFVDNADPVVYAGGDLGIFEGTEVTLSGFFTDPGILDTHTVLWEFGDGATADTLVADHTYLDDGAYVARLTVTDNDGGVSFDELTVTVTNVAPVVDAGTPQLLTTTIPYTFDGTFSDVGILDTHTILWDFGDGNFADTIDPTYTYTNSGIYDVSLTVTDDDGGATTDTVRMTVQEEIFVNENNKAFFHNLSGLIEVSLVGPGSMRLFHIDGIETDFNSVFLNDTTDKSILKFNTKYKKSSADVGDILINSDLGKVVGKTTSLHGMLQANCGALGAVFLADMLENSHIQSNYGGIDKVKILDDIKGTIESDMGVNKVLSKGGLTDTGAIIAHDGDVNKAFFKTDVNGSILASDNINSLTSARGTLTGTIRAGDFINKVKFNDINAATISSGGNINSVLSNNSIADSLIFAGYDIGADGLPGTGDESFNNDGADINKIKVNPDTGDFFNSSALAGVKPFDYNPITDTWTILAPQDQSQEIAPLGAIGNSTVGQVFLNGDQNSGIYGLFAASEIGKVKFTEIGGAGAPDFELISTWL